MRGFKLHLIVNPLQLHRHHSERKLILPLIFASFLFVPALLTGCEISSKDKIEHHDADHHKEDNHDHGHDY